MKKWTMLSLLLPLIAAAGEPAQTPAGPMTDVLYVLRDRYCMRDGSIPSDAGSVPVENTGLVFGRTGKMTFIASLAGNINVDVKYSIAGNKIVYDGFQGGRQVSSTYRVNDRDLTLLMPANGACGAGEKVIAFFDTDGQDINNPIHNSLNTGFPYDLNWALGAQLNDEMGYKIQYVGFKTAEPNIVAIDQVALEAKDGLDMIKKLAERANRCIDVQIDDVAKTVTVKPREVIFIDSQHIENSTYAVEGREPFTLQTNNESRERYFCILRPELIEAEWQKKAFAEYLKP